MTFLISRSSLRALWRNRWFAYCVRAPLLAFVVSTAFLYFGQDWLLFAGSGGRSGMPVHDRLEGVLPDAAGQARAWMAEPEGKTARATVIVFHGNFALAQHLFDARHPFIEAGLRVVFAEYPGYGLRQAEKATHDTVVPDAQALLQAANKAWPDQPLWVFGESLGSGIAAQAVAGAGVPVQRVMLMVPWNRLDDVAAERYPWVPVKSLIKATYDSCAALKPWADRVWLGVAEQDKVIPAKHGLALAHCLGTPTAQLRVLPRVGHNEWFYAVNRMPDGWQWLLDTPAAVR